MDLQKLIATFNVAQHQQYQKIIKNSYDNRGAMWRDELQRHHPEVLFYADALLKETPQEAARIIKEKHKDLFSDVPSILMPFVDSIILREVTRLQVWLNDLLRGKQERVITNQPKQLKGKTNDTQR